MRLFYHYLPCLACHGDLNSRKATYVAEFIPDFRLLIGSDRYYRNNQFAVSFIDSVKHFGITHWRNFRLKQNFRCMDFSKSVKFAA